MCFCVLVREAVLVFGHTEAHNRYLKLNGGSKSYLVSSH